MAGNSVNSQSKKQQQSWQVGQRLALVAVIVVISFLAGRWQGLQSNGELRQRLSETETKLADLQEVGERQADSLSSFKSFRSSVFALNLNGDRWVTDAELYSCIPMERMQDHLPPSHPAEILLFLMLPFAIGIFSNYYGLLMFMVLPIELVLGSLIGFFVFEWTPSLSQHLLCFFTVVTAGYAWSQRDYFDD